MAMHSCVIVNPTAAHGRLARWWPRIEAVFHSEGFAFETAFTEFPGHATELAREAIRSGCSRIVAVGGDGTLREVVNGMMSGGMARDPAISLSVVPFGTGGDFVRSLGGGRNSLLAARQAVRSTACRCVDVGEITLLSPGKNTRHYFLNVAATGLAAAVVARTSDRLKRTRGTLPYLVALITTLARYRNSTMEMETGGGVRRRILNSVVIANGQYFGGGMRIAPGALIDDAQFDVVQVGDLSALQFLWHLPKLYRGTHIHLDEVETERVPSITVNTAEPVPVQADGDIVGTTPASFRVLPRVLKVRI